MLKSRAFTLSTIVCLAKATVFPEVLYGCESWTIKKAQSLRIDAFELWCWKTLLRVPWTTRRSNQSILKEISPEYSLEGLMLKLKLQYFGHLIEELTHWKRPWCWERLKAGEGDDRRWGDWMASPTQWTWVWVNSESWWWTGNPGVLQSMGSQRVRHDWVTELNWTIYSRKEKEKESFITACETGTTQILKSDKDITRKKNCRPRPRSLSFPGGPVAKNPPASAGDSGDTGSIPGSGRSPEEGNGNPLQYSCLENSMDRGAWRATVHGVTNSWTGLSAHTQNPYEQRQNKRNLSKISAHQIQKSIKRIVH